MSTEIIVPNNDDKNIATITHLAGTVFFFVPALIVWVLKKDDSTYLRAQSQEALNFQITVSLAMFVFVNILGWIIIGFFLAGVLWLLNIVFCIIAAISTSKGESYRYPFSMRLIN